MPKQKQMPPWKPRINVNIADVDHALWMATRVEVAQRNCRFADVVEEGLKLALGQSAMDFYRSLQATYGSPELPGRRRASARRPDELTAPNGEVAVG